MVLLLLTSARAERDARQRLFVTTSWVSAADGRRGDASRSAEGEQLEKLSRVGHSVAQRRLCCTDFFTGPPGRHQPPALQTSAAGSTNWPRCGPAYLRHTLSPSRRTARVAPGA